MSRKRLCLWVSLVLLVVSTTAWAQPSTTVSLTTDPEKPGGFLLELTVEAFKEVGYEPNVRFEPWARAVDAAINGEVDGLLGCFYSDERAQKLTYSDELAESSTVFFALERSRIAYSTLQDLSKYTIGTVIGSYYPPEFTTVTSLKIEPVSDYIVNMRKLLAGRIDLFVEKRLVVMSFLAGLPQSEAGRVVELSPPLMVSKHYNAFSKAVPDAQEKLRDFNRGLQMIKDNGLYAIIMKKSTHE
jgi:polar amino acid transport system substrate-binding protein